MDKDTWFRFVKDRDTLKYEEYGDVKLIHLILGVSMLKEMIMSELIPTDPNADKEQLFFEMIRHVDNQGAFQVEIEEEKEELFN